MATGKLKTLVMELRVRGCPLDLQIYIVAKDVSRQDLDRLVLVC
jgi:hypothetical protein